MSEALLRQLRSLGDDDPESIFAATPLWSWQKKQAVPVESVNIFTVMHFAYRATVEASVALTEAERPALEPILAEELRVVLRQHGRLQGEMDPDHEAKWQAFLDQIGRDADDARRLEDYAGGW